MRILNVKVTRAQRVRIEGRLVATAGARRPVDGPVAVHADPSENLLIEGATEDRLRVGDHLCLPGCVLAVSEPLCACFEFTATMGFAQAAKLMVPSGCCGNHLGGVEPGQRRAGGVGEIEAGPREVNGPERPRDRMTGWRCKD